MNPSVIIFPVFALMAWTMAVLLLMPLRVFKAVRSGQASLDDFRSGVAGNPSSAASMVNRNFVNLLEVPVLFYVVCMVLYVSQTADAMAIYLAWGYFGLRVLHSFVHLTYNRVLHRGIVYGASNLVLVILLATAFLKLMK